MASKIAKQEKKQNEMDPDFESYAKPDYWDTVTNSPLIMGTIMFAEKPTRNQKTKPNQRTKKPKPCSLISTRKNCPPCDYWMVFNPLAFFPLW